MQFSKIKLRPVTKICLKSDDSQNIKKNIFIKTEIKKEDDMPIISSNDVEKLLKSLHQFFDYKYIIVNNKYAIEINHKNKNIKYVLEVDKNFNVTYNEKIINNELKSQIKTDKMISLSTFIKNEIFSYYSS